MITKLNKTIVQSHFFLLSDPCQICGTKNHLVVIILIYFKLAILGPLFSFLINFVYNNSPLSNLNPFFSFSDQVYAGKSLSTVLASLIPVGPHDLFRRKQNHLIACWGEKLLMLL